MSTLKVRKENQGLLLEYGHVRLALDTGFHNETTLLTHSHSDHISEISRASRIVATHGTVETLEARGTKLSQRTTFLEYGEAAGQLGVKFSALNAGHVLGSTMFLIEFDTEDNDLRILYTGDFNVIDSLVHEGAKSVEADVLIMETTFGTPKWVFPDREETYGKIVLCAQELISRGKIPVFRAYSLGKAQEAIALLGGSGINVVSGNSIIDRVCEVYNNHGSKLKHVPMSFSRAVDLIDEGCAIVTSSPKGTLKTLQRMHGKEIARILKKRMETFSLSGWALGEFGIRGFPLSAHTDFNGLLSFAEAVNPKVAYCFTENAREFSNHLIDRGVNSVPLE